MFELRWLKKETFTDEFDGSINISARVLQYRTVVHKNIDGFTGLAETEWTDWKDVPTQTEGIDG